MFESPIPYKTRKAYGKRLFKTAMADGEEGLIKFDDLDAAVLGIGQQHGKPALMVYSASLILEALMKENKWDMEAAQEWYGFNIECMWVGERTPVIINDLGVGED